MRKITLIIFLVLCMAAQGQRGVFVNGAAASLFVDSNSFLSIGGDFQNLNCDPLLQVRFAGGLVLEGSLINNDTLKFFPASASSAAKARVTFRGYYSYLNSSLAEISGTAPPQFYGIKIDKGIGNNLTLNSDIICRDTLEFQSGFFRINNRKVTLQDPVGNPSVINHPFIKNERQGSQFFPSSSSDTGSIVYKTIYSQSVDINPANIGIEIKGLLDIGSTLTVKRAFRSQVYAGKNSVIRYFDLQSQYPLANNLIKINYTLNDQQHYPPGHYVTGDLQAFISNQEDMNWYPLNSLTTSTFISAAGPFTGFINTNLSAIRHPNASIDSTRFRITIADPNCLNPPVSGLQMDTLHICALDTSILDAGNSVSIPNTTLKYEWHQNGGGPPHYSRYQTVIPNTQYQKIHLKLMDVRGCLTLDSVVIAPAAPFPVIKYLNHLNACLGDSVTIKDTITISSGTFTNLYTFSDNTTMSNTQQFFKKLFQNPGSHAFQLTSTSQHGCSTVVTRTNIEVYPPPTASFSSEFDCATSIVTFSNQSQSNHTSLVITSNKWNFDLPSVPHSTISSPAQSYTTSGNYLVTLVTKTSFGCIDSVTNPVVIYPRNSAAFTKNNACLNDTVYFTGTSTCLTGSCSLYWDFGDQTTDTSATTKKKYNASGLYNVRLKIAAPLGCPDSTNSMVFINPLPASQFSASANKVCINEPVYFQNQSTISSGSIISNSWNLGNSTGSLSLHSTSSYSNSGIYSIGLTVQSDSGCVSISQQSLLINPQPQAQFAVNQVCEGNVSKFIAASSANQLYKWDFGNSVTSGTLNMPTVDYIYPASGQYSVQLIVFDSNNCSDTIIKQSIVLNNPTPPLGGTVSTCGDSYILDAHNTGSAYYWLPGAQSSKTIAALHSGTYSVQITNTNGCQITDEVSLKLNAVVKPHLGKDTAVCGAITLNAGYPGGQFLWSDSSTLQTLKVSSSGLYHVKVTDQNNCSGSDTINITIKPLPSVTLPADFTSCSKTSGFQLIPAITGAVSYTWNTGASSPSINVHHSGMYWLNVTAPNGCSAADSITVASLASPLLELGPPVSICGSTVLNAKNAGCSYLWNTGDLSQYLQVDSSGRYLVTVTNPANNCTAADTIDVTILPPVEFSLGPDTTICDNLRYRLDVAHAGITYLWTTGSNTPTLDVTSPGNYGVTVTNKEGCKNSDHVTIRYRKAPTFKFDNYLHYICGTSPVQITPDISGNFSWQGPDNFSSGHQSVSLVREGKYHLKVSDNGCETADSLLLVRSTNTIEANFLVSTNDTINRPVQFVNLTQPEPLWQTWTFGDGQTSSEQNPVHTYVLPEDYQITLEVGNGYCTDKISKSLSALFRMTINKKERSLSLQINHLQIFPNPTNDEVRCKIELSEKAVWNISIKDINGRKLSEEKGESKETELPFDLSKWSNGLYIVQFHASNAHGNISHTAKIIKTQ